MTITGRRPDGSIEGFYASDAEATTPPKRVWYMRSHNAETGGTNILSRLIPSRRFEYPKSLYAVEDTLRFIVGHKPRTRASSARHIPEAIVFLAEVEQQYIAVGGSRDRRHSEIPPAINVRRRRKWKGAPRRYACGYQQGATRWTQEVRERGAGRPQQHICPQANQ